jgi:hypothetical protein
MLHLMHHITFKQQNEDSGTVKINMLCMGHSDHPYFLPDQGQLQLS